MRTVKAVIGLGFGDEGKGLTTDYLARQSNPDKMTMVVRYSGGQQAGHTVKNGKNKHVFSNFGSGTFKRLPTYWSRFCTVDPEGILGELEKLVKMGYSPLLFLDKNAPVTTPYEKAVDQSSKLCRDTGTCGLGVGLTVEREENHYSLTVQDLLYPSVFEIKMNLLEKWYSRYQFPDKDRIARFVEICGLLVNNSHIRIGDETLLERCDLIFEGSQGILLDQKHGFFPHVTRSHVDTTNIHKLGYYPDLYLVTRAYQTRHGNGPMTNEDLPYYINVGRDETNGTNTYQGKFRRSLLDLDLLRYSASKALSNPHNSHPKTPKTLVITCIDHLLPYRYTHNGEVHTCNESGFVEALRSVAPFTSVLLSYGPEAKDIRKF